MEEHGKDKNVQFTPKIDLSKLNDKKFEKKETTIISMQPAEKVNPELVINNKTRKFVIFLISILAAIVLATVTVFVFLPKPTSPMEIDINFSVDSFNLDFFEERPVGQSNKIMPGESFISTFKISALTKSQVDEEHQSQDVPEEVFVRVKLYGIVGHNYYDTVFEFDETNPAWTNNWLPASDGYIYYKHILPAGQTIDVLNKVRINPNLSNKFQGKTLKVCFVAECLQAGENGYQAIESEWVTAPFIWKAQFQELVG